MSLKKFEKFKNLFPYIMYGEVAPFLLWGFPSDLDFNIVKEIIGYEE